MESTINNNPTKNRKPKEEVIIRDLFMKAGVEIDGKKEHDIQVHDEKFYARIIRDGSLGLGESYMEGMWDSEALDKTMYLLISAKLNKLVQNKWTMLFLLVKAKFRNLQSVSRAFEVGEKHYDIGNDLYEKMLDHRMMYTCAYWQDAATLEEAQDAKLELICKKIGLKPGMRVLDIGCGWGGFAHFAAEKYGAEVTGITISKEQASLAKLRCENLPVNIELKDYRHVQGQYDAVISIGMIEHVGAKNYRTYMETVDRCLKPDGIAFVQTISGNRTTKHTEPWIHKYIFPNSNLPSLAALSHAMDDLFSIEDVHNFGPDYDKTLLAWYKNFADAWPELKDNYDERFFRMWSYYLLTNAACFRARYLQLFQVVMTKTPTPLPKCRLG